MNNVGVYGNLTIQNTDLLTGDVTELSLCNLITNYGLGRFFAPKEINAPVANRIYFGYKDEAPSILDDVIPANWKYVEIKSNTLSNTDNLNRTTNVTTLNKFSASGVIGSSSETEPYLANHAYLAYVGSDGVAHALTSFKVTDLSLLWNNLSIEYNIVISYMPIVVADGVSNLVVGNTVANPTIPLNALYEENAFRPSGVTGGATDNYCLPLAGEWDDLTGKYTQKYKIIINNTSANTSQRYWLGTGMIGFTVAAVGEYELSIVIDRIDPEATATAVTAISKYDSGRLRISGSPYQNVSILTKGPNPVEVASTYIGADGFAYVNGYATYFNSGKTYTFVTTKPNGSTATADLVTPDERADALVAFYRNGPNSFRAVGNNGDRVEIFIHPPFRSNYPRVSAGAIGTCNIPSEDDPTFYYCDIVVDPDKLSYDNCEGVSYTNTDLAGNVYTNTDKYKEVRNMYFPNMSYAWYKKPSFVSDNDTLDDPKSGYTNGYVLEIMEFNCEII